MRNEVEKKKWAKVADTMNIPKMVGLFVKLLFKNLLCFYSCLPKLIAKTGIERNLTLCPVLNGSKFACDCCDILPIHPL